MSSTSVEQPQPVSNEPPRQPLTPTVWLILVIAVIGFAYDTYALLVMPLIARPALGELLGVDLSTATGSREIVRWLSAITFSSAICGGVFGLIGGYLTDRFGRRAVLTWSILLYAVSALASGFATSALMLLVLRCMTFIGVCVEFVAAVAWLAELFPNPKQRETVLGYTQAFSSFGGLLVSGVYLFITQNAQAFPPIFDGHQPWRYALISAVIPAIPLIVIRPFLPESPVWRAKRAAGTLQRPHIGQLFQPKFRRTTIVTAALFACSFGAAFGALQLTPQMVPGIVPGLERLVPQQIQYEAAKLAREKGDSSKLDEIQKNAAKLMADSEAHPENVALRKQAEAMQIGHKKALAASKDEEKLEELRTAIETLEKERETQVAGVQIYQEVGGLVGRFALAWLALRIVSRRGLLWVFQVPGLIILPLVYAFPAAGRLPGHNIEWLRAGIFLAGFCTIAQLSFWGNYLPRVYPVFLRGTGEGFAANVGGRMFGTSAQLISAVVVGFFPAVGSQRFASIAFSAAIVGFGVYAIGSILTFFLPEPKEGSAD